MGRKGDAPEYVRGMQQEVLEVLIGAISQEMRKLDIHRRLNYSRRCADAYQKRGLPLAPRMEIGCMVETLPSMRSILT